MSVREAFPLSKSLSSVVLLATIAQLSVAVLIHSAWLVTGNAQWLHYFFGYQSPVFFISFSVVELSLSIVACQQFSRGQSLRMAWVLISITAACRLLGGVLSHLLSTDSYLNPLFVLNIEWYRSARVLLLPLGRAIGGSLSMGILACGLILVLRLYGKLGLLGRLKGWDWGLLGIVSAYSLIVAYTVVRARMNSGRAPGVLGYLDWAGDPLLCLLLFESVWIRRSLLDMGWGFISKCWACFVTAIFLTSLGSMGYWATNYGYFPWPESSVTWYVWYLVSAAFALAPIYQVEASRTSRQRLAPLLIGAPVSALPC